MNFDKIIFGALVILLGMVALATTPKAEENNFQTQMLTPTWKINGTCSATMIKSEPINKDNEELQIENLLLTAAHCVRNTEGFVNADVIADGKVVTTKQYIYDRMRINRDTDLSVIKLRDNLTLFPTANIAVDKTAKIGDQIYAVGFPLGFVKLATQGMLTAETNIAPMLGKKTPDNVYITSVPIIGGNSGGGLYQLNNGNYELIGVASRGMRGYSNNSLFSTLDNVKKMTRYLKIGDNDNTNEAL